MSTDKLHNSKTLKPQIMWAIPYIDEKIDKGAWMILNVKPEARTDCLIFSSGIIDEEDVKRAVRVRVSLELTSLPKKVKTK
jgi:hypothetical protein